MANDYQSPPPGAYNFLIDERIENYFADINIKLLRGRHIQRATDRSEYVLLDQQHFFNGLHLFYRRLYKLELRKRQANSAESYFYLDYSDEGRGELATYDRHIELTEKQTIFGLMILNMYYEKFLERTKQISWNDIMNVILHSDRQDDYKRVFLKTVREDNNYTDVEWARVRRGFDTAMNRFEELGWVTINTPTRFTINTSIHRLEDLYKKELDNPDILFRTLINHGGKLEEDQDKNGNQDEELS